MSAGRVRTHILVPEMLEELQFSVRALRQDWGAEGLHDLLDGNGLAGELVLCRTDQRLASSLSRGTGKHTRRDRTRPCPRAAGRCTLMHVSSLSAGAMRGRRAVPARYLKGRAKDLRAHEFGHVGQRFVGVVVNRGCKVR